MTPQEKHEELRRFAAMAMHGFITKGTLKESNVITTDIPKITAYCAVMAAQALQSELNKLTPKPAECQHEWMDYLDREACTKCGASR